MPKKRKATGGKNSGSSEGSSSTTTSTTKASFASFPASLVAVDKKKSSHQPQHFQLNELVPGTVWVIPDFLTAKECQRWIDFVEQSHGLEYMNSPGTKYMANRECYRMQEEGAIQISEPLYERLLAAGILPQLEAKLDVFAHRHPPYKPVGFNPNIRLYKYTKGHAFGKHVDGSHPVDGVGQTEITILIYLSSCKGGATRFYTSSGKKSKSIAFDPEPGAMLLHVHGDACLEHEADVVLDGIKYVLRTDMVFSSTYS